MIYFLCIDSRRFYMNINRRVEAIYYYDYTSAIEA